MNWIKRKRRDESRLYQNSEFQIKNIPPLCVFSLDPRNEVAWVRLCVFARKFAFIDFRLQDAMNRVSTTFPNFINNTGDSKALPRIIDSRCSLHNSEFQIKNIPPLCVSFAYLRLCAQICI